MSATAPRRALDASAEFPDPVDFVATSTEVGAPTWPDAAVDAAADGGFLVSGRTRMFAGLGVAAALSLPDGLEDEHALVAVSEWLAGVECAGAAQGVVALGAFPFDRASPATLVVPSVTWCRDAGGRTWRVDVRRRVGANVRAGRDHLDRAAAEILHQPAEVLHQPGEALHQPAEALHQPGIAQVPSPAGYAEAVANAVADIRAGRLHKVVLGRMVEMALPQPAIASAVLRTLWGTEAIFSPFSVPTTAGRLVGASPELIVSRHGSTVLSHALGGTVPLGASDADAAAGRLFDSAKDRSEHRLVVEQIVEVLSRCCTALSVPDEPTVVRLRSDARLGTLIRGTLAAGNVAGDDAGNDASGEAQTALALLGRLHPTPAVGGVPRASALERIAALEQAPRDFWAGAAGWTDAAGDGEWVLAIRSVELEGRRARVRAGAGIVEDSEPQAELAETTVKLRPVVDALWPGAATLL